MVASVVFAVASGSRPARSLNEAYESFREAHGRPAEDGDRVAYARRLALFEARQAEVVALNARPGASWQAGINHFADYSVDEFRALLGFRRLGKWWGRAAPSSSSFLDLESESESGSESGPREVTLAETMDWRQQLNISGAFQRDQGHCGSCWAVAAVGALEMHAERRGGPTHMLSFEQLVDCVPNPDHCGGDGGCQGATAELAFEYVASSGLAQMEHYKGYASGGDGQCKPPPQRTTTVTSGFVRLPENRYKALLEAVALKGPVVASVDAGGWSLYKSGIFDSCIMDATVNHAVLMIGYGHDQETGRDYWLIRNSWTGSWGENGLIRLLRHSSDEGEAGFCGIDKDPKEGVGCDGGPAEIPVCGMCGVLSDSSYPTGVRLGRN